MSTASDPAPLAPGQAPNTLLFGFVCGLLAAVIWGGQAVVSRQSVADGLSAADVTILRYAVAALLMAPFAFQPRRWASIRRLGWQRAVILTLMVGTPYSMILVTGAAFAPALHSSVISPGLIPVFTAVLAYLVLGERATPTRLLGLGILLAGIALFSWTAVAGGPALGQTWIGDLLFVATAAIWSSFGLLARRWKTDPIDITIVTCVLSVPLLPLLYGLLPSHLAQASLAAVALQGLYQGVLVGVCALFFYAQSVASLGASRAALFLPLVPAVTAVAAFVTLGERASPLEIAGMTLAIVGMVVALRAPSAA